MYEVDKKKRKKRQQTQKRAQIANIEDHQQHKIKKDDDLSLEKAEARQVVAEMTRAFVSTIEFYNSEWGGKTYQEAVEHSADIREWRRGYIEDLEVEKVEWGHLAAVGENDMDSGYNLWLRIRESAADELASGRRTSKVIGEKVTPYEKAQYLAIRDAFADQWQPQGGIESALIEMLAVAFSLQMYWMTTAHQRAVNIHNEQTKELNRYENKGWKSPYQYEADAIEQAHRLADSYNRQFLRVLRQLRDLRRYSPITIQNNGGQVNIAEQQINGNMKH